MNTTLRIRAIHHYETQQVRTLTERPATLPFPSPSQRIEQLRRQWIAETERFLNAPESEGWSRAG